MKIFKILFRNSTLSFEMLNQMFLKQLKKVY